MEEPFRQRYQQSNSNAPATLVVSSNPTGREAAPPPLEVQCQSQDIVLRTYVRPARL